MVPPAVGPAGSPAGVGGAGSPAGVGGADSPAGVGGADESGTGVTPPVAQSQDRAMLSGMARIAIIGGGSIGEALLAGLLRAGRQVKDLVVAERDPARAKYLSEKYTVQVTTVAGAVDSATYVVVAVKPADVPNVIGDIADTAAKAESDAAEQVFVTVAAGVTTAYYENKLPAGSPVVRVMPNAPMLVGGGVSALARGRFATADHLREVSSLFDAVGGVLTVAESQLDAVTAMIQLGACVLLLDGRGAGRRGR